MILAALPESSRRAVPDASPTMNMDRPEEFNSVILEFLETLKPDRDRNDDK